MESNLRLANHEPALADGGRIVNLSPSTTALMLPTYAANFATKGRWDN